jgi:hypothetical protein
MGIPMANGPANELPPPSYQAQGAFPSEDSVTGGDYLVPEADDAHAE